MSNVLISAIMPTRNRPQFAQQALACFFSQTWPNKELIILDDRDAPSFARPLDDPSLDWMAPSPRSKPEVHYELLAQRRQIGAKRNLCCSRARGDLIAFMDDDDWYAPEHLEHQAHLLIEKPWLQVVGYGEMEFHDLETGEARLFNAIPSEPGYCVGSSMMFRKQWWRDHPFNDKQSGEDVDFIQTARALTDAKGRDIVLARPANGMMWASKHGGNTSPRAWQNTERYRRMVAV